MVVRSLLVYRLTGSAAILGLLALAHAVPMVSLSLFGGVVTDRVQKKCPDHQQGIIGLQVELAKSRVYTGEDRSKVIPQGGADDNFLPIRR